jgi:hypothetical protein
MHAKRTNGNVLLVALILLVVVSGLVAVAVNVTNNSAQFTDRSRDLAVIQAAAEGAVDHAFAIWKKRVNSQNRAIGTTETNDSVTAPTFPGISYASSAEDGPLRIDALDEYGAPVANPTRVSVDLPAYPGWRGNTYSYCARAKLQVTGVANGAKTGVRRQFQYSEVPLFQTMYFFEHDLEFYKPAAMIVTGLVHSNATAYLSYSINAGGTLTFRDQVSYVLGYTSSTAPPFASSWSSVGSGDLNTPIFPSGIANQLHQVPRFEPLGDEPSAVINTSDSNPNNDSFREIIEPPNGAYSDPPEIAKRRMYNKAGIRLNINGSSIAVTGQNGTTLTAAQQTAIANSITQRSTIYDQREGKNVDVATIDISMLRTALSGVGSFNNVLYVHDTTPLTSGNMEPKTIRLVKGGVLPDNGLTIASENPIYIQGDYNTGTTTNPLLVPSNNNGNAGNADSPTVPGYARKPSAVISDAIMLLSNSWSDANASQGVANRAASHTTYNTAIVSGFMPSGYMPPSGSRYGYSGGGNNFPRFLETWGGRYCTYYGSMVELFQSKIFTGRWDTGNIYRPPNRCWNFDTNFRNSPPPGTLDAASWSRGSWVRY